MATNISKRSIFRDKAVQTYRQNREKSILPRIVTPPVFLFCWILVLVLAMAVVMAWLGEIPSYALGSGTIPPGPLLSDQGSDEAVAVVLLPASQTTPIRTGFRAQVQIGQAGPQIACAVSAVYSALLSPSTVYQQYGISVTDPSQAIVVRLGSGVSRHIYAGSLVHVQIQTGSRRLLSLFPLLNNI